MAGRTSGVSIGGRWPFVGRGEHVDVIVDGLDNGSVDGWLTGG